MEHTEYNWERHQSLNAGATLTTEDIEAIARLMAELKELTLSRGSYEAASDFLKRLGYDGNDDVLVRPERLPN
ncbi:MAG: hypothetical protein R3D67_21595 [Hyphomicrobiaceae bacterium]